MVPRRVRVVTVASLMVAAAAGITTEFVELAVSVSWPLGRGGRFAVVAGAGGMGKTALARAVVEQARRDGHRVLWVRWRSLEQLAGQMLEAAAVLGLPPARIGVAQQSGASLPDLVWEHLERRPRWVIVVDNLDQPDAAAPAGEQLRGYRGWIRPTGAGHPRRLSTRPRPRPCHHPHHR